VFKNNPLHPVLFAVFSVIFLAANNISQIPIEATYRPLILYVLFGLVIYVLTQLFLKDWHRSALVASIFLFMFSAYGQIYLVVKNMMVGSTWVIGHRTFLPLYIIVFSVILYLLVRKVKKPAAYTFWLNFIFLSFLIQPIFNIIVGAHQQWTINHFTNVTPIQVNANVDQPDIYYIILDAYGRKDVLLNKLGYDNSEFSNALRQRGFYVAGCSQSNYAYTEYSLPSSLSYDYFDNLNVTSQFDRVLLLKHGAVRSFLESNAYKVVAFPTGWVFTEWVDADIYPDYSHPATTLTEYETFLINTTILRSLNDFGLFNQVNSSFTAPRRLRVLSLLSNIKQLPMVDEKLFVFAHLVVPHPPYSFDANGEPANYNAENIADYQSVAVAYINQVKFVNKEILAVIDVLLMDSEKPPVIIIQGDHGPPPELSLTYSEKMPILNAYYLPGKKMDTLLYPSISPVNTFRVVLNSYFGEDLPLLEDKSYYASEENHDQYILVPNSCPEKQ